LKFSNIKYNIDEIAAVAKFAFLDLINVIENDDDDN